MCNKCAIHYSAAVADFRYPGVNRLTNLFWQLRCVNFILCEAIRAPDDFIGVRDPGAEAETYSVALPKVLCDPIYELERRYTRLSTPSFSRRSRGPTDPFSQIHAFTSTCNGALWRASLLAFGMMREISLGAPRDRTRLLWSYSSGEHFNSRGFLKIRCKSTRHVSAFAFRQPSHSAFIPSMLLCEYTSRLKNHPGISKSLNVRISKSLKISVNIKSYREIEKSVLKYKDMEYYNLGKIGELIGDKEEVLFYSRI